MDFGFEPVVLFRSVLDAQRDSVARSLRADQQKTIVRNWREEDGGGSDGSIGTDAAPPPPVCDRRKRANLDPQEEDVKQFDSTLLP